MVSSRDPLVTPYRLHCPRSAQQGLWSFDEWAEGWNDNPKPFIWHKTAEEIIAKVRRGRAALTHAAKSATDH